MCVQHNIYFTVVVELVQTPSFGAEETFEYLLLVHITLMSSCPREGRTLLWRMLSKATCLRDYQNICWDMQFSRV